MIANGNNGFIYAPGARAQVDLSDNVKWSGEVMPQFGSHRNYDTASTEAVNFQGRLAERLDAVTAEADRLAMARPGREG